jgi:phosphoglycolate phosphatase-like HAD superfamily hydrolase
MRALVLFDIDGTLLTSASAGRAAIERAFADEYDDLGFFGAVRFDGKTDPQIVAELYRAAGHPERATAGAIEALLARYLVNLEAVLVERADRTSALPGVVALLAALEAEAEVCVGLVTGNVVRGAELKLEAAGLGFGRFGVGAFGSDSGHRPDLPAIAVGRARERFGRAPEGEGIVVIGDTPADITCGASLGVRTVAVATGSYTEDELRVAGATVTVPTLEATAELVEAILCSSMN